MKDGYDASDANLTGLLKNERVIDGVDRLIYHKPWMNSVEIGAQLSVKDQSVRNSVRRVGDTIAGLRRRRIQELLNAEQQLNNLNKGN